jgi:hypothetical protein
MGATDMPLALTEIVGSALALVVAGFADAVDDEDAVEVVLTGEKWDMAEPGRVGRFLADIVAFF